MALKISFLVSIILAFFIGRFTAPHENLNSNCRKEKGLEQTNEDNNDLNTKIDELQATIATLRLKLQKIDDTPILSESNLENRNSNNETINAVSKSTSINIDQKNTAIENNVQTQLSLLEKAIANNGYVEATETKKFRFDNAFGLIDSSKLPTKDNKKQIENLAKYYSGTIKPFSEKSELISIVIKQDLSILEEKWVGNVEISLSSDSKGVFSNTTGNGPNQDFYIHPNSPNSIVVKLGPSRYCHLFPAADGGLGGICYQRSHNQLSEWPPFGTIELYP